METNCTICDLALESDADLLTGICNECRGENVEDFAEQDFDELLAFTRSMEEDD